MRIMVITKLVQATAAGDRESHIPAAVEKPKTLVAGEYEVVSKVTKLASTDKSTPATQLKMDGVETIRACVAADGTPDPKMFVEAGDACTATNSYLRSGRLSVQYTCTRAGKGELYPNADGNFTADGYQALVTIASSFPGEGE